MCLRALKSSVDGLDRAVPLVLNVAHSLFTPQPAKLQKSTSVCSSCIASLLCCPVRPVQKAGETLLNEVQSKTVSNYKRHTDTQSLGEEEFLLHYSADGETAFCREHFNLQLI